jgi:hypothetical protein
MSLTSSTFQWLTICVAIVTTIAVIALWNLVHGTRLLKLMTRIGLLAAGYLTTAVAVLVSINIAYGGLIATWGDLFDNLNPPPGNWHPYYRHHFGRHYEPKASSQAIEITQIVYPSSPSTSSTQG